MWANMVLLLCLSLIPVTAEWIRTAYELVDPAERLHDIEVSVSFFGIVGLAAAVSYTVLLRAIIRANGPDSLVGTAVHADLKGKISLALYAAAIGLAFVDVRIAYACYAAVSVIWLVPDRRFMHDHADDGHREGTPA